MKSNDISAIIDQLCSIYDQSVASLRDALAAFCDEGRHPDPIGRAEGAFAYPELRVTYSGERTAGRLTRAFARLTQPGTYACSIARPALFRDYLRTQLEHLVTD
jgi:AMP nucleosidase